MSTSVSEATRAYRHQHARQMFVHPLRWVYWKARHKTWRQRAAIRDRVRFVSDITLGTIEELRHPPTT